MNKYQLIELRKCYGCPPLKKRIEIAKRSDFIASYNCGGKCPTKSTNLFI